jgi:thymidine phosphorylase
VGNALEVQEALDALSGEGDEELLEVSLRVAREMCALADVRADVEDLHRSGAGRQKFEAMLAAQGGRLERGLPVAPVQLAIAADRDGHVEAIDALEVGLSAASIGVGRIRKEDTVDPAAGFVIEAPVGARVHKGDPLVVIHARSREVANGVRERVRNAWRIVEHEARRPPHVLARVDRNGVSRPD